MNTGRKKDFDIEIIAKKNAGSLWDDIIRGLPWCNIYQSYNWGEIKKNYGWKPVRAIVKDSSKKVIAAVQVLTKKKCGFMIGWAPGGPLFNAETDDRDGVTLLLNELYKVNSLAKYLKIYPMIPLCEKNIQWLILEGWHNPRTISHKSFTVMVDLDGEIDSIRKRLTGKWRYDLKQSEKFGHNFESIEDEKQLSKFIEAHKNMCKTKGLNDSFDLKELKIMKNKLNDDLLVFGTFENNLLTSGWIIARFLDTAYVLKAVTTDRGKEILASYLCLWEAMKYLKSIGCKRLEMGGIDPQGNPGVTHFKRGTGGKEIKWLGEWELVKPRCLRWTLDIAGRFYK